MIFEFVVPKILNFLIKEPPCPHKLIFYRPMQTVLYSPGIIVYIVFLQHAPQLEATDSVKHKGSHISQNSQNIHHLFQYFFKFMPRFLQGNLVFISPEPGESLVTASKTALILIQFKEEIRRLLQKAVTHGMIELVTDSWLSMWQSSRLVTLKTDGSPWQKIDLSYLSKHC